MIYRKYKLSLIFLYLGQPESTGPGSPGWVEVIENSISYGFDVTRVMFCSGNCTERMRMGKEVREKESFIKEDVDRYYLIATKMNLE